ncbi:proenkephalin-B-like [Conger conger]|uniref:proenkephalin-B-like n=1 Tax=Conger conger TaxID=82655 RepID=UPI002A5A6532|nr:proenkephalin-B-like [Conger conger]XP_061076887.1 proenkephalin-B-like [Conger conger]XP_061076888.1 proenkephalin-B-like [Conger conger]
MEWYPLALVLCLSLASSAQADCSTHCLICAQQSPNLDTLINSLTCTLECEGTLSSTEELDKCDNVLRSYAGGLNALNERNYPELRGSERGNPQVTTAGDVVKRYGGFIKKIDKNKVFSLPRDNASLKRFYFAPKYDNSLRKLSERDIPEAEQDSRQEDGTSEDELTVFSDDTPINAVKRYGGFLRKFAPKRSYNSDENSQEELQKRYGGFMRRIRPKLKWDSQKRYGGILRRHFKISVRSDEDPGSYDVIDL